MKPKFFFNRRRLTGNIAYGSPVFLGFTILITGLSPLHGDILRGGGGGGGSSAPAAPGGAPIGGATPADTAQARANAQDTLARTSNTLNALRAMQDAARAAAKSGPDKLAPGLPSVPNGLGIGGLNPTTNPTRWTGAELPTESLDTDGLINVGIRQTAQQALLDWQTFNVGKNTVLNFDQSAGGANAAQWIAFNRINDPTGNPSQILGQIKAQGQVYVINPNGIIFGGSSQVNARGLTVSSLPINTNLIERGLLNNPDAQFLFSGLNIPAGSSGTPSFTPEPPNPVLGRYGDIIVQAGATLSSPTNAANVGGRIMLVAPDVINQGTILTPDGQTILAAGLQVGINAHNAADPSLRGLDAYIGAVGVFGNVINEGVVEAPRGSILMAGRAIQQNGALELSTSVSLNGRIDLLAHYDAVPNSAFDPASATSGSPFLNRASGTVALGADSVMRILPELASKETTIGTSLALRSRVNIEAGTINTGADSILLAPNALVNLNVGEWIFTGGASPISRFIQSAGTINVGKNTIIDVSGSRNVAVPISQNYVTVDLRGAELADSPLQRFGALRGQTITVDIRDTGVLDGKTWIGTPLADVSGFINLIQRGVGQLTTAGGTVNFSAGSSLNLGQGSIIDVSAGSVNFSGGNVGVTQLISATGSLVDISNARPDQKYLGIYSGQSIIFNKKWGVLQIYNNPLAPDGRFFESGYTQGSAGGVVAATAPVMTLDGRFYGETRLPVTTRETLAAASRLSLSFTARDRTYASLPDFSPSLVDLWIDDTQAPVSGSQLRLSSDWFTSSGFREISIENPDGDITLAAGTRLDLVAGSAFSLTASNINIGGAITTPGGGLSFTAANLPLSEVNRLANTTVTTTPQPIVGRGIFTLGEGALLSTAGQLVDQRAAPQFRPLFANGGTVQINALEADLSAPARIDVSGGATASATGRITYGNAGGITVTTGRDIRVGSLIGGGLSLGATLEGYSGARAGSIALTAPAFRIGSGAGDPRAVQLDPAFFQQGGFGTFTLTGLGIANAAPGSYLPGVLIESGAVIRPQVTSRLATALSGQSLQFLSPKILPEGVRSAAEVNFNATGVNDPFTSTILTRGDILMADGSSITTDAGGRISFDAQTVEIRGSLTAPGGRIRVAGATQFPTAGVPSLLPTVLLSRSARISAAGTTVLTPDPFGLRVGRVFDGGTIEVAGNIVAADGAVLDVSGTSGVLDLSPGAVTLNPSVTSSTSGRITVPVTIESNGGLIRLSGSEMLHFAATATGEAGGASAAGGTMTVASGRWVEPGDSFTSADINLEVRQGGTLLSESHNPAIGSVSRGGDGSPLAGLGIFLLDRMSDGGFSNLELAGNVRFAGDVNLSVPGALRLASGGVIEATGAVNLTAGSIHVGQNFRAPTFPGEVVQYFTRTVPGVGQSLFNLAPRTGTGALSINAGHLDVGTLSLDRIGQATLSAINGDIRGNGILQAAGILTLEAGQIHPTTGGRFDVFVYDYQQGGITRPGTLQTLPGADRPLPWSAGGRVRFAASVIDHQGNITAPFGAINLGWNGDGQAPLNPLAGTLLAAPRTETLTLRPEAVARVSAIDPLTGKALTLPYGISLDGSSWLSPGGVDITLSGPPEKEINLGAVNLNVEEGAILDISGGGDLYAYRWVEGNGGRSDVLANNGTFAIIPDYAFDVSPYASFNTGNSVFGGTTGYQNSSLRTGDRITLAGGAGLPAGSYTLLPARYALLPGAFLITPNEGVPTNPVALPDGAARVAGFRSNGFSQSDGLTTRIQSFEIAPSTVVRTRSEYVDFLANTTFPNAAQSRNLAIPLLPRDAGYVSFAATQGLSVSGTLVSTTPSGARGSRVDISSPVDIIINSTGTTTNPGALALASATLNSFGAESLIVGGLRKNTDDGVRLSATTGRLTLDLPDDTLQGNDIVLLAREFLEITDGSSILALPGAGALETYTLDAASSANGVLVRVSGSDGGSIIRDGAVPGGSASLNIGDGVILTGGRVTLDSTSATNLSAAAFINADTLSLGSGSIRILLDDALAPPSIGSLDLGGGLLDRIRTVATGLVLRSYSSIDIFGTGIVGDRNFKELTFDAPAIRGFNQAGGDVVLAASNITLGNQSSGTAAAPTGTPADGTFRVEADLIRLGANITRIEGFENTILEADSAVQMVGTGSLVVAGNVRLDAPVLTATNAASHAINATGLLAMSSRAASTNSPAPGLGSNISLTGSEIAWDGNIDLPSGSLSMLATSGDLVIGGLSTAAIRLEGSSRVFSDVTRYTAGGVISLSATSGDVRIASGGDLSVSGNPAGGNAGSLRVAAPNGEFELIGSISANSMARAGSFLLDTASVTDSRLGSLDETLNEGNFNLLRDYRVRNGSVEINGLARSTVYRVATDLGAIVVTGNIDASGTHGGTIDLKAHQSLTLESGALLNASALEFDSAGKGGAVTLEAGNHRNGIINSSAELVLSAGSTIDLGVAAADAGSARLGQFSGTLHLRAPRTNAGDDVRIAPIASNIIDASHVLVEGYKIYDLTGSGVITSAVQTQIRNDANAFLGANGTTTAGYSNMLNRLTSAQPGLDLILAPGAEIINRTGGLTLGTTSSSASADWNLATNRFGPLGAAGVLTLRAADNLTFFNALSDGFSGGASLWLSPLMAYNPALPANAQSWSYRMAAGADLSASSFRSITPGKTSGVIEIGKNMGGATTTGGTNVTTASIIANNFQVVRTGSGNIEMHASSDFRLLNPFASVYTAGTAVPDATTVNAIGDFILPVLNLALPPLQGALGGGQQSYFAQYSMAGGNVIIQTGNNIERKTRNNSGLIDDSSRQLPNNWLYRRSYVDGAGLFGAVSIGNFPRQMNDPAASTTWWVDFSNFFQSVGALGGGHVSLIAGNDVTNVDAVIPTNARAPMGVPNPANILELGGGDLLVSAGRDISGGVYYVERGEGSLNAGRDITTNATRSPSLGILNNLNNPGNARFDAQTWIPTLLFAGKSSFDLSASGNILAGPAANTFLLPQGLNNRFWYKSFFNTFAPDSAVTLTSLGGDITLRNAVTLPNSIAPRPVLQAWLESQNLLGNTNNTAAWTQPWLRLSETSITPLVTPLSVSAPTLSINALAGDVRIAGNLTLFPSPIGGLEILAAGGLSALQPTGLSNNIISGQSTRVWTTATWNVSDANPASLPTTVSPLSPFALYGGTVSLNVNTQVGVFSSLNSRLIESGSFTGINAVSQTKQARHTPGLLHRDNSSPVRILALDGDISGLTLFTPKSAIISAARDITDVSFYIQNLASSDISLVTAGRDIVAFNSSSPLRVNASSDGNATAGSAGPLAGDIQISGPGTLQVLAGRNLDLGVGANNADGTGAGITSIGNLRNPFLSERGADILVAAGLGSLVSLASSDIDFHTFAAEFILTPEGDALLQEIAPGVDYISLSAEEQAILALEVFYRVLRDAGRDFNNPESPFAGSYTSGLEAIAALFGTEEPSIWNGEVLTRSRDIRTRSGGNISILAPGGGLAMSDTALAASLTPPGIITESGGSISIFTNDSVDIGIGRIFTLRGGDITMWSSEGDIAAGSSSRTVQSAPPTRVVVDPQSASVETDLAGLATGGGIGVLATVEGVDPGDVDLIAPSGIIDAGDSGIRVTGNINLAATQVVNAANIAAGGTSSGGGISVAAPAVTTVSTPPPTQASPMTSDAEAQERMAEREQMISTEAAPSVISVEVIGYGGGGPIEEEDEDEDES